jgi:hypothetical protein
MYLTRLGSFICRMPESASALGLGVNGRRRTTLRATPLRYMSLRDLFTAALELTIHLHIKELPFGKRQCQKTLTSPIRLGEPQDHHELEELRWSMNCVFQAAAWKCGSLRYSKIRSMIATRQWLWWLVLCSATMEATGMFRRLRSPQSLEHVNSTSDVALHLLHYEPGCYMPRLRVHMRLRL